MTQTSENLSIRKEFIETFKVFRVIYGSRWGSINPRDEVRQADNKLIIESWCKELKAIDATSKEIATATENARKLSKFTTFPPSIQDFIELINFNRFLEDKKDIGIEKAIAAVELINDDFTSRYGTKWQVKENYIVFLKNWALEIIANDLTISNVRKAITNILLYPKFRAYAPTLNEFIELCKLIKCDNPPPTPMVAVNKITTIREIGDLHPLITATLYEIDYQSYHQDKEKIRKIFLSQYGANFIDFINGEIELESTESSGILSQTIINKNDNEEKISSDELACIFNSI